MTKKSSLDFFSLKDRVAIITGGTGLLGRHHGRAIASAGGMPVLLDLDESKAKEEAEKISQEFNVPALGMAVDITSLDALVDASNIIMDNFNRVDILINNAANNPKVETNSKKEFSRLENFPIDIWNADIAVGLTGAFLCSRVFGSIMAKEKKGTILNIASDLAVNAPDQRLYRKDGVAKENQPVKPVTYSVVKAGLVGLTRYLATYWAEDGVRVNSISPGGVYAGQPEEFVAKLSKLIPMGRMANEDEYEAAVLFLCSDASSYMTGQNILIDGGRSAW